MKKQILLFMLAFLLKESWSNPDETRLRRDLFDPKNQIEDLKTTPVPVVTDVMQVDIFFFLTKLIALDVVQEVMKVQYTMEYVWYDYRLKWNASDYGGILFVHTHSTNLWSPELLLTNNAKPASVFDVTPLSNYVEIESDGKCVWRPRFELSAMHCHVDIAWFPFDTQTCEIEFQSWVLLEEEININIPRDKDALHHYLESDEWDLTSIEFEQGSDHHFPTVTILLHLRRKPLYYIVNLVAPCCLLSFIVIIAFLLPPSDRLGLAVTLLLAMSVYQVIISNKLPSTSTAVPIIVIYFLFLIGMCGLAVLVSIVLQLLYLRSKAQPLEAMSSCTRALLCKGLAACLCMRQSPSPSLELTEEDEIKNDWMVAAAAVDRICAIILIVLLLAGNIAFFVVFATRP